MLKLRKLLFTVFLGVGCFFLFGISLARAQTKLTASTVDAGGQSNKSAAYNSVTAVGEPVIFTSSGANYKAQSGIIYTSFGQNLPSCVSLPPDSPDDFYCGESSIITTAVIDADGWQDIEGVYILINTNLDGARCCYAYYNLRENKLYLRNDDNTAWLGGYAPQSDNVIGNSYVLLNCLQTSVSSSGTDKLVVNWSIEFKDTFIGSKNVYLKIKDSTAAQTEWMLWGNFTFLLDGVIIGPEGGEVTSRDGKVKVTVPAGALNTATRIIIKPLNKEGLSDALPSGKALLSVVECKPYGLVFNKPVSIRYTLPQAEIPGTPVELGFYDALQDKILSTGQTSVVPADGYLLTFPLSHFSTYAALKGMTPQSTPIGSGVQVPLPDMLTGAFSHSIPFVVPAGRKGMQPGIGLVYRSSGANSWVGLGFSLNPGYIVRSTRLGPASYSDEDTFYFVSDGGTTELVRLTANLYQAKIESSFAKFYKETDDSWRVVNKDGSILRFAQSSDAKETSASGTFSWYLTKAIDNNGNYMEYRYTKDQGKCYLSRIDYTGNEAGLAPANSVEFSLEDREDISSSYTSTARIATAKRLHEVQVEANGLPVWRYVLEYTYSPDTNRSLLTSVKQYASDGKCLPQQGLKYQGSK